MGTQDDRGGAPKSTKEKTTKAERRALQEAQRAAKAALKESGEGLVHFCLVLQLLVRISISTEILTDLQTLLSNYYIVEAYEINLHLYSV